MHTSSLLLLAALGYVVATPAPQSTNTPPGPFFLGSPCSTTTQCPDGSQCYAVNSMLIPRCGNTQASCTSDAQCAVNSCVSSFCAGPVRPTLPLGTPCYDSSQCANGASCYAVNSMLVPRCGNLQAQCVSDAQCAYNTCVGGFCGGVVKSNSASSAAATSSVSKISSSIANVPTTTTASVPTSSTISVKTVPAGTGSPTVAPTRNSTIPTATRSPTPVFTGLGEKLRAGWGSAFIGSAVAFALMIVT